MTSALIYAAIIVALSLFTAAEVIIQYQKFELKKQYIEELDEYERAKRASSDSNDEKNETQ